MKKRIKKAGGTISDWQVHHLSYTKEQVEQAFPEEGLQPIIVTGTVVSKNCGKFSYGDHMRSSLVFKLDRKEGVLETRNSIYELVGKENNDIMPDIGDAVLTLFY